MVWGQIHISAACMTLFPVFLVRARREETHGKPGFLATAYIRFNQAVRDSPRSSSLTRCWKGTDYSLV